MSMPDYIKQQVFTRIFLPKRSHSPGKRQNWILRVGEPAHISKITYLSGAEAAWHTVFNLLHNVWYKTTERTAPNRCDRGSNPVAINQFSNFFLYRVHMFSLSFFSFANILYFTWLTLSD